MGGGWCVTHHHPSSTNPTLPARTPPFQHTPPPYQHMTLPARTPPCQHIPPPFQHLLHHHSNSRTTLPARAQRFQHVHHHPSSTYRHNASTTRRKHTAPLPARAPSTLHPSSTRTALPARTPPCQHAVLPACTNTLPACTSTLPAHIPTLATIDSAEAAASMAEDCSAPRVREASSLADSAIDSKGLSAHASPLPRFSASRPPPHTCHGGGGGAPWCGFGGHAWRDMGEGW